MPVLFAERFDFGEELPVLGPAGIAMVRSPCLILVLLGFFLEKVREQWAKGSNFLVRSICNGLSPVVLLLFLTFYYQYKVVFEYFCLDSKKKDSESWNGSQLKMMADRASSRKLQLPSSLFRFRPSSGSELFSVSVPPRTQKRAAPLH
jgi:hypothetical protein